VKEGTCWLSLSTRSPKLSRPSTLGTPASSDGHRGVDGNDIFNQDSDMRNCLLLRPWQHSQQKRETWGRHNSASVEPTCRGSS
jgi:hypothetical protein